MNNAFSSQQSPFSTAPGPYGADAAAPRFSEVPSGTPESPRMTRLGRGASPTLIAPQRQAVSVASGEQQTLRKSLLVAMVLCLIITGLIVAIICLLAPHLSVRVNGEPLAQDTSFDLGGNQGKHTITEVVDHRARIWTVSYEQERDIG